MRKASQRQWRKRQYVWNHLWEAFKMSNSVVRGSWPEERVPEELPYLYDAIVSSWALYKLSCWEWNAVSDSEESCGSGLGNLHARLIRKPWSHLELTISDNRFQDGHDANDAWSDVADHVGLALRKQPEFAKSTEFCDWQIFLACGALVDTIESRRRVNASMPRNVLLEATIL